MDVPTTRYAHAEFGDIAYQTVGEGPLDLLIVHPMSRCLDAVWDYPAQAEMLRSLAQRHRLILFDRRGSGISDPLPADLPPTWEDWLEDILAVLAAAGADQVALLAERDAAAAALLFASSHPERVRALLLGNTSARFRIAAGYPCGESYERSEELSGRWERLWGTEEMALATRPTLAADPAYVRWVARMQRAAYSPRRAAAEFRYILNFDARAVLGAISAPTLVMHRKDFDVVPLAQGRHLARHIVGARFEVLSGRDMDVLVPGDAVALGLIESFLAQAHASPAQAPALLTVLLADIPDTLQLTDGLGRELRARRDAILSEALTRFQGQAAGGDPVGLLASFDGPARALRFAQALRQALHDQLRLDIRIGLHAGECRRADGGLAGAAVDVGSGVLRAARAGEVLASVEVRDLAIGSGIAFRSVGHRGPAGSPGARELFAVEG